MIPKTKKFAQRFSFQFRSVSVSATPPPPPPRARAGEENTRGAESKGAYNIHSKTKQYRINSQMVVDIEQLLSRVPIFKLEQQQYHQLEKK